MSKTTNIFTVAIATFGLSGTIASGQQTLGIKADVGGSCTLDASGLNFGTVTADAVELASFTDDLFTSVAVKTKCSVGTNYQVIINDGENGIGQNAGDSFQYRMQHYGDSSSFNGGGQYIEYKLSSNDESTTTDANRFNDNRRLNPYRNGANAAVVTGYSPQRHGGREQSTTLNAKIENAQLKQALDGRFSDTVTLTLVVTN